MTEIPLNTDLSKVIGDIAILALPRWTSALHPLAQNLAVSDPVKNLHKRWQSPMSWFCVQIILDRRLDALAFSGAEGAFRALIDMSNREEFLYETTAETS